MRIIAGKFKGNILKLPKSAKTRPTKDVVKGALFNILGKKICGASFLELFAGSGNIGIEALSRGAEMVVFVENNPLCTKAIAQNLTRIGVRYSYVLDIPGSKKQISARILPCNIQRAIKILSDKNQKFDLVFLDPPYYQNQLKNCLIKICHYDILKPQSWVILEHNRSHVLPHLIAGLKVIFAKSYGETTLSFYKRE